MPGTFKVFPVRRVLIGSEIDFTLNVKPTTPSGQEPWNLLLSRLLRSGKPDDR